MPVTTREYSITSATPDNILTALELAFSDLGWYEANNWGYLANFTATPGSAVPSESNRRYLVRPSACTSNGTGAVFDVLRSPPGNVLTVTVVTGGNNYSIVGYVGANSSTGSNVITLPSTTGVFAGQLVTKLAGGTGTLQTNTLVDSVVNSTAILVNLIPTTALSNATVQFSDIITISANSIGGNTYNISTTASNNSTVLLVDPVANVANIVPGQRVIGTNIGPLAVVSSIAGNAVTISRATIGVVSGSVTYSDEITITASGITMQSNVSGIAVGNQIINVATNANLYVGARINLTSGTPKYIENTSPQKVTIASITGSGPYTLTLRNPQNTFKGFTSNGAITFNASDGDAKDWFEYDNWTAPQTYAWGVAKIANDRTKKLGTTFWHFYVGPAVATFGNAPTLSIKPMTGFNLTNFNAQGVSSLDWFSSAAATSVAGSPLTTQIASSWYVPLTLRVRQSGVDPNFATFAFFEGNNNRNPFFISKYNTAIQPWDLDDVFLGGCYEIVPNTAYNTNDASLLFRMRMNGYPKRGAEAGYMTYNLGTTAAFNSVVFRSITGNRSVTTPVAAYGDLMLYSRQLGDVQTSLNPPIPIYKNVPIYPGYLPVPYYLPEDFIIAEIPWVNPAIRDTITVSGGEVYTIVQLATNQITYSGIALAARTT